MIAAKKRYDHATAVLKELLDKRDTIRKDEILSAIVKSGRSYEGDTEIPECGRNKGIDRECTTAVIVVRVLGGKFLKVHIFADL